ncbi:hypothetical protein, partial [Streptobacillus moniliformis]|uniref:hypothetical protein n=1 Tax=Streptobacillus moniliformis TaxID=34105 RepID=UPI0018C86D12
METRRFERGTYEESLQHQLHVPKSKQNAMWSTKSSPDSLRKPFFMLCTGLIAVSAAAQQGNEKRGPIKVEVVYSDSAYQLKRGGQPYFVKGAGGSEYFNRVAAYGGNSIRTWGTR